MRLRLFIPALAAALVVGVGLAVLPVRADDGLTRFETMVKPKIPPGVLTYAGAKGMGASGFELIDVVFTPPPEPPQPGKPAAKPVPIRIERITIDEVDFDGFTNNEGPAFAKVRFSGLSAPAGSIPDVNLARYLGTDLPLADLALDYRFDRASEVLTLNKLAVGLRNLGHLEIQLVLDGVTPASAGNVEAAKGKVSVRTASVIYRDESLLSKLVPALAADAQMDPVALQPMVAVGLDSMTPNPDAATRAILDALISFVGDFKAPKGALIIAFNPPAKTTAGELEKLDSVNALIKAAGLTVTYAGTVVRPIPPAMPAPAANLPTPVPVSPAPVTPAPPRPPAAGPTTAGLPPGAKPCQAGARFYVLHEDAWQSGTAVEAATQRCIVRIDGTAAGQEVAVGPEALIGWSLDGPGQPVAGCQTGDKVLVLSDAAWYPATIKAGSAGGKCPVHFDGFEDEHDETVPVGWVRVLK